MYYTVLALVTVFALSFLVKKKYIKSKVLVIINFIITSIYFIWRLTVIPFQSLIEAIIGSSLLIAEIIELIQFLISQFLLSNEYKIKQKFIKDFKGNIPTVDIFICTYNEPEYLVEITILASLNLDYEADKYKVYLCDDGKRDNMRILAQNCGIGYITRESNEGAKAGNINNALTKTNGDLFVVLDADMICSKEFLNKTVGYFSDLNVAFVQTPQVYYNKDIYQRNLKKDIPNEQDFFMREIQEARATINAVLHVGTNAVFRRKYVIEVGMYPTNTITEDMAMGMILQASGYKTIFINEVLVLGLTASTYTDLVIQRDRWCRGSIQANKEYKPLRKKGLSLAQKIAYFSGNIYWYTCFAKMIFILCPILFMITTKQSMNADFKELITFFIPFILSQIIAFNLLISNTRSLKWAHYYEIAIAPHMCKSIFKEKFSSEVKFSVTPKDIRDDKSYFQTQVITPHLILGLATISSWIIGLIYLNYNVISPIPFFINLLWSFYNFIAITVCIRVAYHIADVQNSNLYIVQGGHNVKIIINGRKYKVEITAFFKNGIYLKSKHNLKSGKAKLIIKYDNKFTTLNGVLDVDVSTDNMQFFYDSLDLNQKKLIIGIYVEHLQPTFNVKKDMNYI